MGVLIRCLWYTSAFLALLLPDVLEDLLSLEIIAIIVLAPEFILDRNSAFGVLAKLFCCQNCSLKLRQFNRTLTGYFEPSYARKIKGIHMGSRTTGQWATYTFWWISLLVFKCYFSYYYEVRLQVQNQANVWTAIATPFQRKEMIERQGNFFDLLLFDSARSVSGGLVVAYGVIIVTWIPILVV